MEISRVVTISHRVKWLGIQDIARMGTFAFAPAVNFKSDDSANPQLLKYVSPFQLFSKGLSMELLIRYSMPDMKKEEFKVAERAYHQLRSFAARCADRVIADLVCGIVLQHSGQSEEVVYVVQRPPSDKIVGRLGYLYLPVERLTILFVAWEPMDLITNVMRYQTGRLEFDLHRLMSEEKEVLFGPYPGSPAETLKQTYFYRPPRHGKKRPFPLRIEVFSQGLLESDLEGKGEIVRDLLQEKNLTPPFQVSDGAFVRLPRGLKDCLDAWTVHEKELDLLLRKEAP